MKYIAIVRGVRKTWRRIVEIIQAMDHSPVEDAYLELAALRGEVERLKAARDQAGDQPARRAA